MPSSVTPMPPTHTDRGAKAATEALSHGRGLGLGRSRTAGRSTGPGRCRPMGGSQDGVTVAKLARPHTRHTRPRARLRSTQPPPRARALAWVVASRVGDPRRCHRTLNASSATLPRCTARVRTTVRRPWHRRLGQPPAPAASTSLGVATSIHTNTDTGTDTGISTGVSTMMRLAASTAARRTALPCPARAHFASLLPCRHSTLPLWAHLRRRRLSVSLRLAGTRSRPRRLVVPDQAPCRRRR